MNALSPSEEATYRGFSCPYEPFDESFFALLSVQYATSLLELFGERFGEAAGDSAAEGLFDFIERPGQLTTEIAWTPALAAMTTALRGNQDADALPALAQFLLDAAASGAEGVWSLDLPRSTVLLFDRFVLPSADSVQVEARDGLLSFNLKNGRGERSLAFRHSPHNRWESGDDGLVTLPSVEIRGKRITLLSRQALPELECGSPLVPVVNQSHAVPVERAVALFDERVPECADWVARVLRRLILVEAPPDTIQSGNFGGCLGMFYVSSSTDPLLVAEMLVHECCHQYYHALCQLEEMVDPADTGTYFSPFVNKQRPLDRILLAYHAFANVYLYYWNYFGKGDFEPGRRVGIADLVRDTDSVQRILEQQRAKLTPVGDCLFQPLFERMGQCLRLPA